MTAVRFGVAASARGCVCCLGTGRDGTDRYGRCRECIGTGREHVRCGACDGRGYPPPPGSMYDACRECRGYGRLDVVTDARIIDIQRERAAARAAGLPTSRPATLAAPEPEMREPEPAEASAAESSVEYDEDALRSIDEAWRAAEGPQRRALPGRRAA